jgi:leukotriene-A4 hydrolase
LGQGIKIETRSPLKLYSTIILVIEYSTSKNSSSLHFVEPNETSGKRHWFVYSQCSAILCRSLFPSQVINT